MLFAITPSAGISAATTSPNGPPVAAASTSTVWKMDPGGTITSLGSQTLYNISTAEAVPGGVAATVTQTPGGHYVCQTWVGQASPGSVIVANIYQAPGF